VDSKIDFEPYPDPKNSPLRPQKVKSDPKMKSKSKVRIYEKVNLNLNSTPTTNTLNFN